MAGRAMAAQAQPVCKDWCGLKQADMPSSRPAAHWARPSRVCGVRMAVSVEKKFVTQKSEEIFTAAKVGWPLVSEVLLPQA